MTICLSTCVYYKNVYKFKKLYTKVFILSKFNLGLQEYAKAINVFHWLHHIYKENGQLLLQKIATISKLYLKALVMKL